MAENAFIWSVTAASNGAADAAVPFPENMVPGQVNNSARGLMAGVARLIADLNGTITTGGGANVYTVTSNSGHTALTNGILVSAKASYTNTAAASLNLNAYGTKNIKVFVAGAEAAVAAGQIIIGGIYQFRYDSAADSAAGGWILLNPSPDPTTLVAVGDIKIWPGVGLPTGYLWANGQAVSRSTYLALFSFYGTSYGAGDGSTTFNVPDLCGRAPFGADDMGGIAAKGRITSAGSGIVGTRASFGGVESVTLTLAQAPAHAHAGTTSAGSAHSHTTGIESAGHTHTYSGTTGTVSANHTHPSVITGGGTNVFSAGGLPGINSLTTGSTGNQSADHTHTFSGTSDGESANHTHAISNESAHTHTYTTDSQGGGALHTNMPPALILNYIVKT